MATQQLRTYKCTLVVMLNYVKPGNAWTVESQLTQADLTLSNVELMRWFNFKAWGHPDLAPDHAYAPQARSNSLLCWKKCISFFMPNKNQAWDHSLIKRVTKMEARRQGVPSEAWECISEIQFRLMNQVLLGKEDASVIDRYHSMVFLLSLNGSSTLYLLN
jgi:hypothetical protein